MMQTIQASLFGLQRCLHDSYRVWTGTDGGRPLLALRVGSRILASGLVGDGARTGRALARVGVLFRMVASNAERVSRSAAPGWAARSGRRRRSSPGMSAVDSPGVLEPHRR